VDADDVMSDDVMSDDVMSDDVMSDDVMSDDVRSDDPRTGAGRGDDLQTRSRTAGLRDDGVPTGPGAQPGRADRTGPSAPDVGFFGPRRPPREARRGR
jgi:hypothetical protein